MNALVRRLGCVLAAAAVMAGCELANDLDGGPLDGDAADPAAGVGAPRTLPELVSEADLVAREWQREPVLAEVTVVLASGADWLDAELTYVAGDADRLLSIRVDDEGALRQDRLMLETLGLQPLPGAAAAEIPPLPDAVREPGDLVAATEPELAECLAGPPTRVAYATGAPTAWDGSAWIEQPSWRATVWHLEEDGGGQSRAFDPVTAEPVGDCVTID